ncbi:MAG: DEAD/DEAH box helicase [Acidimicrobiia bacterium]|nr:DEAD/DEAH box helicase [Acidimicrobiia bacterium]
MGTRTEFEASIGFSLDDFQRHALDALDAGRSVLVAAPTGSGKTIVAEYAIARALARGGKAFYTTPLKALSNQKFGDLVRIHGNDRVGLLTGDNSVNGDAPVVVMTTEVLRNMIYAASPALDGLDSVVLDEVHYLQDRYRGAVWEEVIVHLPPEIDLVCLSATVSNAEEFAAWIETVRGATTPVIEERRPVELHHRYLVGERDVDALHLLPTFVGRGDELAPNPEAARLDRRVGRGPNPRPSRRLRTPGRTEVAELLAAEDLLPAIVFVFSRKGCDQSVEQCLAAGLRLTTPDERVEIRRIAEAHVRGLSDSDLAVLGYDRWLAGLESGLAAHHAGMVPPMKEAVEAAFAAGLAKVVFATETLALGINMPARSVVIEKLSKFTGERHELLTPGEYTQLTGRAGRRGIDAVGYAVVLWSPWVPFEQVAGLASRRTDALRSSFRPTYNMTVNLVGRYSAEQAHHLLNLSFAQFHVDRDVVALERQLARADTQLHEQRALARSDFGDVDEYRKLLDSLGAERRGAGAGRRIGKAMEALVSGDIVWVGGPGGKVVVLAQEARRGSIRILALGPSRHLVRLAPDDFEAPPVAVGRVDLPQPYAPRNRVFQRTVLESLRRKKVRRPSRRDDGGSSRIDELETEIAAHPVDRDPERDGRVRASGIVVRLERDRTRLEKRVRARSDSLARQLDRVRRILESRGYLDGWSLTPAGSMLARLYADTDLLLAESLRDGLFDGLEAPEMAALVSCFTYERRGSDGAPPVPPARWPSSKVAQRARRIDRLRRALASDEAEAGLPETRPADPGFTPYAYEWAAGDDLGRVLDDEELTGGDFVRHIKQCIDLLRQIVEVAPEPDTRNTARAAADACHRGVVVAGNVVAA